MARPGFEQQVMVSFDGRDVPHDYTDLDGSVFVYTVSIPNPRARNPGGDPAHPDPALCPAPEKSRIHWSDRGKKAGGHGRDEARLGDRREKC